MSKLVFQSVSNKATLFHHRGLTPAIRTTAALPTKQRSGSAVMQALLTDAAN